MTRLLVFLFLLALVAPAFAQPEGRPGGGAGPARAQRTLWWNAPDLVESLSLSEAQRKEMDAAWSRHEAALGDRAKAADRRKAYQEALEAGRWDDARKALEQMSEAARLPVKANGELKIVVLEQLSAEQRAKLVAEHPMLLRQAWAPRPHWAARRRPQGGGGPRR